MMRLSDILDHRVDTEAGRSLGRVFDFRVRSNDGVLEVEDLLLGRRGLSERLGVGNHGRRQRAPDRRHVIPWSAVVRVDLERGRVIVRDEEP
jgi:sporulation protein YlmC with PRC-barrel domain